MNIHIIDLRYLVDEDEVVKVRPAHREFLDSGYENGTFIASGPKADKTGGVILAKGDINEIKIFIKNDPFLINKIAKYSFSSFDAVKHIPEISI
ncbi:MAG: hypothetical protein ACI9BN_000422 [Francisella sp.]|jgi:uncharacterized protein YciI